LRKARHPRRIAAETGHNSTARVVLCGPVFILVATSNVLFLCFVAALIHSDQLQRLCRARELLRDLHNGGKTWEGNWIATNTRVKN
jgi:hypothetical protein